MMIVRVQLQTTGPEMSKGGEISFTPNLNRHKSDCLTANVMGIFGEKSR